MNGIDCFFEGFRLVRQPGIRQYVLIPMVINILVLGVVMAYGYSEYDRLMAFFTGWVPDWLAWMAGVLTFLAAILIFAVGIYLFTIVANIIASPFNAILSEKVEDQLVPGDSRPTPGVLLIIGRSVARELSKILYLIPRLLLLLIISFIPVVNSVAPFAWLLFGGWMMAIQYVDYAADNNQVSFKALRQRLATCRVQAVLFGLLAYFVLAIPVLNLLLMPVAVAGGTVFWVGHLKNLTK